MILDETTAKRLIIYFIYDKDGIIDDYIPYMLRDLRNNCSEIAISVNGKLTEEGRAKLEPIVDTLLVRENKGFDVWAYKAILDQFGWEKITSFDEVVMMNFTIMGPVYPMKEMFTSMSARDLDFWGITMFHEYKDSDPFGTIEYGYIPDHIQSHFIAVRKPMLESQAFQDYWNNMGEIKDYRDAVGKHEAIFTRKFAERGFKWDVYADMGAQYNRNSVLCAASSLVKEKRCPIFKRRSFMQNYANILHDTAGQEAYELFKFLDKETDYDVNMIWDNILRLENQADIKKNMHLNYICSQKTGRDLSPLLQKRKIALVLHLYFEDLAEYCCHYMQSLPQEADIYVTVCNEEKKAYVEKVFAVLPNKVEVIIMENRGRDVGPRIVGTQDFIQDYDYVCYMHDKKVTQLAEQTLGVGFSYRCFENLLGTKELVENILWTMEENPRAGMLMPPPPNHGDYYMTLGLEWTLNYENTKKLAEELGLTVPITDKKEPIAPLGGMFWCRPQALHILFDQHWTMEDFPPEPLPGDGGRLQAIERIFGYVVQQAGYYPAWVLSDVGASMEITNLNYMVRELNVPIFEVGSGAGYQEDVARDLWRVFGEWRMCRGAMGYESGNIVSSRLYLKGQEDYSETNSYLADDKKSHVEGTNERAFIYDEIEYKKPVSQLRWDPGEAGSVVLQRADFTVTYEDGTVSNHSLDQAVHNGVTFEDQIIFLAPDPQVYINLPQNKVVKEVRVECDFATKISPELSKRMAAKLNPAEESLANKLKRKMSLR